MNNESLNRTLRGLAKRDGSSQGVSQEEKATQGLDALLKSALFQKNYFFLIWIKSVKKTSD